MLDLINFDFLNILVKFKFSRLYFPVKTQSYNNIIIKFEIMSKNNN